MDPDNGLEPTGFTHGSARAGKSVTLDGLPALRRLGRCPIVYHHHTGRRGGYHAEIEILGRTVAAGRLRSSGRSPGEAMVATGVLPAGRTGIRSGSEPSKSSSDGRAGSRGTVILVATALAYGWLKAPCHWPQDTRCRPAPATVQQRHWQRRLPLSDGGAQP